MPTALIINVKKKYFEKYKKPKKKETLNSTTEQTPKIFEISSHHEHCNLLAVPQNN